MEPSELIKELFATLGARLSATLTLLVTPALWAVPHLASPLWPSSTQVEVLFAQAALAFAGLAVGSLVTLGFVVAHARTLAGQLRDALDAKGKAEVAAARVPKTNRPQARDHAQRLDPTAEAVLVWVTKNPGATSDEVAEGIGCGEPLALHHLESLLSISYVKDAHIPGSPWSGTSYRHEWSCHTEGRTYQAKHGLLP